MKILLFGILVFNSFLFGLSNEILADKYLISAQKSVKEKNYKRAVENFEKIFALGVSVPNDIYYFYAKSLKNSGDIIKSYDVFDQYIEKIGRGSKHYKEALGFMIDMEEDIAIKKRVIRDKELQKKRDIENRKRAREKAKREEEVRRLKQIERQKKVDIKKSDELNRKGLKALNERNYQKTFLFFKKALELNNKNGKAQCNIAYMYNNGLYVNKDFNKGLEYTKKSIKNNYCYSNLGYAYEFGKGTDIDYQKAIKLYVKAIKKFPKNSSRAYYHLGVMIAEGKGSVVDYKAAREKFEIAERYGDKDATKYLEKLDKLIEEEKEVYEIKVKEEKKLVLLGELKMALDSYAKSKGFSSYPVDTYIDERTMLMWEDQKFDKRHYDKNRLMHKYTFEGATKYCDNLTIAGLDDWRIPSFYELLTILDYEEKSIKEMNKIDTLRHEKFAKMHYRYEYKYRTKVKYEFYFVRHIGLFWSSSKYARGKYDKEFKKELRWVAGSMTYGDEESEKNGVICVRNNR